jgi:tight adherence protein B
MSEPWMIGLLFFAAVVLGVEAIYVLVSRSWRTKKSITRRLTLRQHLASRAAVLNALREERSYFKGKNPLLQRLNDRLAQTGLRLQRGMILLYVGPLLAVLFLVWSAILGPGFMSACGALLTGLGLIVLWLEMRRQKRMAEFTEQLPDALDVIVRGVRVGYPLPIALNLAARELSDPLATEFAMTFDEITFGQDVRTAIENLYRRVGHEDLQFFVVAIIVQNQTGGNLAEVLSRLSRLLRTRLKLRLKIRSLSAEGRISAVVLSLMPFILFGAISLISPGYFGEIRNDPLVMPALVYGVISLLLGNIVMHRMVHFKF